MEASEPLYIRLLEEYRVPLLAICLPISCVYGICVELVRFFKWWVGYLTSKPTTHAQRVARIKNVLIANSKVPQAERKKVTTDRANTDSLTLGFYNKRDKCRVPTSCLHHILSLDPENRTVTVEVCMYVCMCVPLMYVLLNELYVSNASLQPMVTVQEAADYLIPKGFILSSHLEYGRATLGIFAFTQSTKL